jgi:hypothetical protein
VRDPVVVSVPAALPVPAPSAPHYA